MERKCSTCKTVKPIDEFHKNKSMRGGHHYVCKPCRKKYEDEKGTHHKRWLKEKDRFNANHDRWVKANREKYNAYMRNWNKENKDYSNPRILVDAVTRRVKKASAMLTWVRNDKEHMKRIKIMYILSRDLTNLTGIPHEVDHVYPIQGKDFSGLHVWWNLQILPMKENRSKGNKQPSEENIIDARVRDNWIDYLKNQLKIYADLYQNKDIESWDKKLMR